MLFGHLSKWFNFKLVQPPPWQVMLRKSAIRENAALLADSGGGPGVITWVDPEDLDGDGIIGDICQVLPEISFVADWEGWPPRMQEVKGSNPRMQPCDCLKEPTGCRQDLSAWFVPFLVKRVHPLGSPALKP